MTNRVLIASEYNAKDKACFALSYEFCKVVAESDDADVVAPDLDNYVERYLSALKVPHDGHNVQRDFNRLTSAFRKTLRLRNAPTMKPVTLDQEYEIFFFVAWSPQKSVELARIDNWRGRCKIAVAYLHELWVSTLEQDRSYLELLDQFDHVFLLHSACLPQLRAYTRAPCSWLPTAVDCLTSTPYPDAPKRVVDVYSYGNRAAEPHRRMVAETERGRFFYIYDSLSSTDSRVKNWGEHRRLVANLIKRSRYFIAYSPASLANPKASKIGGEQVVPTRLFEGAAGGAVILGTAPDCDEFRECFDWRDAVIEVPPETSDIVAVIEDLDKQPERLAAIRRTNATQCLLRHDWVYRWEHILSVVGVTPRPQLAERKARLRDLATGAMSVGTPAPLRSLAAVTPG